MAISAELVGVAGASVVAISQAERRFLNSMEASFHGKPGLELAWRMWLDVAMQTDELPRESLKIEQQQILDKFEAVRQEATADALQLLAAIDASAQAAGAYFDFTVSSP